MRKQMIENAAFEVATQVRTVEDNIDSALVEIAELQTRMVRFRTVAPIGVAAGQGAFQHLATALQALVAARGGIADCHAQLAQVKSTVPGLRTVAFGDGDECPPQTARADLRVVA